MNLVFLWTKLLKADAELSNGSTDPLFNPRELWAYHGRLHTAYRSVDLGMHWNTR